MSKATDAIEEMEEEIEDLKSQLSDKDDENYSLQTQLDEMTEERDCLKEELYELREERLEKDEDFKQGENNTSTPQLFN